MGSILRYGDFICRREIDTERGVLLMESQAVSRRDCANAIRALSMDAVQRAKSGHPGAPMGMADIAEVLWRDFMVHNPGNPNWFNRDRFILSNGHGSMLIYSLLHLTGYDLSIEEVKNFRQLHSKTPGHPEYGYTPGVETTTGPWDRVLLMRWAWQWLRKLLLLSLTARVTTSLIITHMCLWETAA